jgi:hypothetical protein
MSARQSNVVVAGGKIGPGVDVPREEMESEGRSVKRCWVAKWLGLRTRGD